MRTWEERYANCVSRRKMSEVNEVELYIGHAELMRERDWMYTVNTLEHTLDACITTALSIRRDRQTMTMRSKAIMIIVITEVNKYQKK